MLAFKFRKSTKEKKKEFLLVNFICFSEKLMFFLPGFNFFNEFSVLMTELVEMLEKS